MAKDKRESAREDKFVKQAQEKEEKRKKEERGEIVKDSAKKSEISKTDVTKKEDKDAKKTVKKPSEKRMPSAKKSKKVVEKVALVVSKKEAIKSPDVTLEEKKKKPKFIREGALKNVKSLAPVWRRPNGRDTKTRMEKRGKGKIPKIGYRNKKSVRGLVFGFSPVRIELPRDLEGVDAKRDAIIISRRLGQKKRNEIVKKANERKIRVINPRKGELSK